MRLIDADALADALGKIWGIPKDWDGGMAEECEDAFAMIDNAPTIDAEPIRHGHWIHTGVKNVYGGHQHECSVCGYTLMVSPMCDNEHYCCSCGAKMDEEDE